MAGRESLQKVSERESPLGVGQSLLLFSLFLPVSPCFSFAYSFCFFFFLSFFLFLLVATGVAFELNELFPEDPVLILSGQDTQAQSQAEVVRSAVNRFIKESENRTFSDEEDDLDDY